MMKVKVDAEKVEINASGGMVQIVTDISTVIAALTGSLLDHSEGESGEQVVMELMKAGCASGLTKGMERHRKRSENA